MVFNRHGAERAPSSPLPTSIIFFENHVTATVKKPQGSFANSRIAKIWCAESGLSQGKASVSLRRLLLCHPQLPNDLLELGFNLKSSRGVLKNTLNIPFSSNPKVALFGSFKSVGFSGWLRINYLSLSSCQTRLRLNTELFPDLRIVWAESGQRFLQLNLLSTILWHLKLGLWKRGSV